MATAFTSANTAPVVSGVQPPVAGNADIRQRFVDMLKTTTDAYNQLMAAGRDNDAFALRDAMERFTRSGASVGVNSWARTQAINDLRARQAAAARTLQGTTTANALAAQASILGQIGTLDANTFKQGMDLANLDLNKQQLALQKASAPVKTFTSGGVNNPAHMAAWNASPKATPGGWTPPAAVPVSTPQLGAQPFQTQVVPDWYKNQTRYKNLTQAGPGSYSFSNH